MSDLIINPVAGAGIAIVCPTGVLPSAEVARKNVPAGVPYCSLRMRTCRPTAHCPT